MGLLFGPCDFGFFYIKRDGGRGNQNQTLNSCSLRAARIQRFDFWSFAIGVYIYIYMHHMDVYEFYKNIIFILLHYAFFAATAE